MSTLTFCGIFAILIAICLLAQNRPRAPLPPRDKLTAKWGYPLNDPDSALGAGWIVELDGQRIAELTEPRYAPNSPFWLSYVIVPLTDDPKARGLLFDLAFWQGDRPKLRSRKFGVLASGMLMSGIPPCPETNRIIVRGPYIHLDPGPGLVEKFVGLFKRRNGV